MVTFVPNTLPILYQFLYIFTVTYKSLLQLAQVLEYILASTIISEESVDIKFSLSIFDSQLRILSLLSLQLYVFVKRVIVNFVPFSRFFKAL
jgi:hypothetical protein